MAASRAAKLLPRASPSLDSRPFHALLSWMARSTVFESRLLRQLANRY